MRSERGFTLMELVVVVGLIGLVTAVSLPGMQVAIERNRVITTSELVAGQIRQARLAAITRNTTFMVRFDCPAPGAVRMLVFTGNPAVDGSADRCTMTQAEDGPAVYMPPGITFGGEVPTIRINGRGQLSLEGGGNLPHDVSVSYGSFTRNITVTAAGRVRTPTS